MHLRPAVLEANMEIGFSLYFASPIMMASLALSLLHALGRSFGRTIVEASGTCIRETLPR